MTSANREVHEGKFFALISYIGFLCIVALLLKRENKFTLFHAKQGLVLFVMEVITFIVSIIPFLGALLHILGIVVFTLASLWGMLQVLQERSARIPVVASIADTIIL